MNARFGKPAALALLAAALLAPAPAAALVHYQCPAELVRTGPGNTGPVEVDAFGYPTGRTLDPNVYCRHLTAGDGFTKMADGNVLYSFGFADVTGLPEGQVMEAGMLAAQFASPALVFPEGKHIYLTVTNVGMAMRPDLFDPHTVHFHGFPNASSIFDGEPMGSVGINMGSSITYYYEPLGPGTYLYHCHVEATEHMQMGMLGNLYVTPAQDACDGVVVPCPPGHVAGDRYAYDDLDGTTRYDVAFPIQIAAFDKDFHEEHIKIQPLPFAGMHDTYPMLNGRGYPDTEVPGPLPALAENGGKVSQPLPARITAAAGQRVLLRISSVSTVDFYTLGLSGGLTMQVVGKDAKLVRNGATNLYYTTDSVMLGGGESMDAIVDTAGVPPGTYLLYVKNLNHLSNHAEDYGGMMTEFVITP